ncbi:MAG: cation transporter [Verrucomicrobia bacterium]|nr:cation transporter [Verrucomicrobiota bacterium]
MVNHPVPPPRLQRSLRVTFLGLGVNVLLAAGKFAAGVFGHSHALVADAVESFADVFSSLIVWRGLVVAAAPPDDDHPYGHGKAEPLAAAFVATMLLLAATGIALKSIQEIITPHHGPAPFTLLVLISVVVIKETLFRFVFREGDAVDSSAVRSDAWHHRSDAVTSLAAAIGIIVALVGGKGYEAADDVAAIVAAGIIAWNGWRLLRPALDELMDATPNPKLTGQIRELARAVPGVAGVEKCLVRKMGYQYFVDMHVEVNPQLTVQAAHAIAHAVKDRIRAELPAVRDVLVHIEPGG